MSSSHTVYLILSGAATAYRAVEIAMRLHAHFERVITIRGEKHTVLQAAVRGLTHVAYHTGQILYLARLLRPESTWLTIAPGQSRIHRGSYLQCPGPDGWVFIRADRC